MEVHITARHFKAHDTLREYAINAVERLERYFDGIVRAEIIFSYERSHNSVKDVEVLLTVYGTVLKAYDQADDYFKALDNAIEKVERQLKRYKSKLHKKEKVEVRRVQEKVV